MSNPQEQAAKQFAETWKGRGYEKGDSQPFWISLLRDVYEVEHPEQFVSFEEQVKLDHTSFIDAIIPSTHVLIEQKSLGKSLSAPIRQSDGTKLTPFSQAKRYSAELPYSQRPRWVVTCNFAEFYVYDMERPNGEPEIIKLCDLPKEYYRLGFLVDTGDKNIRKEEEISIKAGDIVGVLYNALLSQYAEPEKDSTLKSLNALCVRLVFCLYAEDAGIFGKHNMFHDYLERHRAEDRRALINLFRVLDQKPEERDPYLDDDLAAFPYVNGGLFADENIEIPRLGDTVIDLILEKASEDFDWSAISPTIFGAVFESTLNPDTRRKGGMHYTSIANIHKVIDPLFLDDLKGEFEHIKEITVDRTRAAKLHSFQEHLAGLKFLDPACGSGNFLTETYLSLRRLENEVIKELIILDKGRNGKQVSGQVTFGQEGLNPIRVSISQFYGIEINDFAVTVAKTALWIAESQMMKETEEIVHATLDFLPLKTNAYIVEGNALRLPWEDIISKNKLNYIMGNPPFVGYSLQSKEQKEDILSIYVDKKGKAYKTAGKIDYVAGWYFKAAQLMQGTAIRTAFVSTNSITQGEQVAGVWKPLYDRFAVHIDFAHRTFRWDSEASLKAHVHCVIVGFSVAINTRLRRLFTSERMHEVDNINAYLMDAPNVFINSRKKPLCNVPDMLKGSSPVDGGNLLISADEYDNLSKKEPQATQYIKRFYGAKEFLHNLQRWCLWIDRISPAELKALPLIAARVNATREFRLSSTKTATQKYADYPTLFMERRQPTTNYILVPRHSSENRKYIPFGFMEPDAICGDANSMIPCAQLYHFGILISNVHMAWVRTVCGRIKSDYRYSNDVVYNNFPWPTPTDAQKAKIEQTAQAILDARALYPDCSLADLYDEVTMPPELRKAHQANDKAVMQAYGFWGKLNSESTCVAELMKLYQELTKG